MGRREVEHSGVVVLIEGNRVDVEMRVESACASCHARGVCTMSDVADKVVSVWVDHPEIYEVGQQVSVAMEQTMGFKAVIYAYMIPFVLLLASLLILLECGAGEVLAGLASLGVCGLYYVVLWLMRHRLEKEIVFKIR